MANLEELTNKIYAEGVEKGKAEAAAIVAKAEEQAAAVKAKAEAEAAKAETAALKAVIAEANNKLNEIQEELQKNLVLLIILLF